MSKSKTSFQLNARTLIITVCISLIMGLIIIYIKSTHNVQPNLLVSQNDVDACQERADFSKTLRPYMVGEIAAVQDAETPQYLGYLVFTTPSGTDINLNAWKGKTVLLNFWATWCAPCREEMPMLSQLQDEFAGKDFEVVAVNIDKGDIQKARDFFEEIQVSNLTIYSDNTTRIFKELRSKNMGRGMPTTLIIDRFGCQLAHLQGPANWASEDAKRLVKAVINDNI